MIDERGRDPATKWGAVASEQAPRSPTNRDGDGRISRWIVGATPQPRRPFRPVPIRRPGPAHASRLYRPGTDARRQEEDARAAPAAPLRRFLAVTCSLPARPGPEGPAGGTAAACRHRLRQAAAGAFRRDAMRCLMSRSSAACSDPLLLLQCGRHGLNTFLSLLCRFDLPRDRGPAW